ncbi:MAG: SET domain-containing protein [Erythrobacter sp.]
MEFRADIVAQRAKKDVLELCIGDAIGVGVRSVVAFARDDVLDRFDGRIDRQVSQHSLQISSDEHIAETRFVGYLSHGCDPNCALDMGARTLVALRDIAAGDLLRVDYAATEDTLFAEFECECGATNCRGWITGRLGPYQS